MKYLCTLMMLLATLSVEAQEAKPEPITLEELATREIKGKLGLPLGTVCEIEAEVMSAEPAWPEGDDGRYVLKVYSVNGHSLLDKPIMAFHVPLGVGSAVGVLPTYRDELELRMLGRSPATPKQASELEARYVGSRHRLTVVETGGYRGQPKNIRRQFPAIGSTEWEFWTSLDVFKRSHLEKK